MSEQQVDTGRRRFLTVATSAAGGVAAAAVATPFVLSFFPSERAKAAGAPVEVDISKLEAGQRSTLNGAASRCGWSTARRNR